MTIGFIKSLMTVLWAFICAQIMPVNSYLLFTMVLVVCDFVTGCVAARGRGEALDSRGFKRTVFKIFMYCGAILLSHGMDKVYFAPLGISFGLVWTVSIFIGLTEFKSNLENIGSYTGADVWTRVAAILPDLFKITKK
jgi:phage-related holin